MRRRERLNLQLWPIIASKEHGSCYLKLQQITLQIKPTNCAVILFDEHHCSFLSSRRKCVVPLLLMVRTLSPTRKKEKGASQHCIPSSKRINKRATSYRHGRCNALQNCKLLETVQMSMLLHQVMIRASVFEQCEDSFRFRVEQKLLQGH